MRWKQEGSQARRQWAARLQWSCKYFAFSLSGRSGHWRVWSLEVWSLEGLSRGVTGHVFVLISLLCSKTKRSGNRESG